MVGYFFFFCVCPHHRCRRFYTQTINTIPDFQNDGGDNNDERFSLSIDATSARTHARTHTGALARAHSNERVAA